MAHPDHGDAVEGGVGRPVTTAIEPVTIAASGRGRDRRDAAQVGEGSLGTQAFGVVAHCGDQPGGCFGADCEDVHQRGGGLAG